MLDVVTGGAIGVAVSLAVVLLLWNTRRPASVEISIRDEELEVRMRGWDVVYCCRRRLRVPIASVAGVCVARRGDVPAAGLRLPGTSLPGVIRAGSFGSGDDRDFWDVRQAPQVLVIQMRPGAEYRRVVVDVADPHKEMLRLRPVLGPAVLPLSA